MSEKSLVPVRKYVVYRDEEDPEVSEETAWRVRDTGSANWALGRLAVLKGRQEEVLEQYQATIERLTRRKDDLLERISRGVDFFTANLTAYAQEHKHEIVDGKRKSKDFIHGRLGFRKRGGRVRLVDDSLFLEWAKEQPVEEDLLRYQPKPNLEALKKYCSSRNVLPPGVEWEEEHDEVYVETEPPVLIGGENGIKSIEREASRSIEQGAGSDQERGEG